MPKHAVTLLAFVVLIVFAFFAFNSFIYTEKQADPTATYAPYQATLTGEYVCLPHKDTDGPQTLECAFGLKTEAGEHFALDFGESTDMAAEFMAGQTVTLSGVVTPIENLSSDHWQKYDTTGILSVRK